MEKKIKKIFSNHTDIYQLNQYRYYDLSLLVIFVVTIILTIVIFLLIIFRRWPNLVTAIVAGLLMSISLYSISLALHTNRVLYE